MESITDLPKKKVFDVSTLHEELTNSSSSDPDVLQQKATDYLWAFLKENFYGPFSSTETVVSIGENLPLDELSFDENRLSINVRFSSYLYAAKVLLLDQLKDADSFTLNWWRLRLLRIWQQSLTELESQLKEKITELIRRNSEQLQNNIPSSLLVLYHLEVAQIYADYYELGSAEESLNAALKSGQFSVGLTGVLGKRTRFQVKDIAQLTVTTSRESGNILSLPHDTNDTQPTNCILNDDTVLDRVNFTEGGGDGERMGTELSPLEQAIVLTHLFLSRRIRSDDVLQREELRAMADKLLENPINWAITASALSVRCDTETMESRRVERALAQSESLVTSVRGSSLTSENDEPSYHGSHLIYERLKFWDGVIACYRLLEKPDQAEVVVRQQLELKETADLYCVLGDITMNVEHYQKAVDISNGKSARALRALGNTWVIRKQFDKGFEYYKQSLDIQPLVMEAWYSLGFCAMELKRYSDAASAYYRCVQIEPDNFQAWNNLSAANVYLENKDKAFRLLQEAMRFNYENWKVWENFLSLSIATGHYVEAVRAYHRLLDLKEKFSDPKALQVLSKEAIRLSESQRLALNGLQEYGEAPGVEGELDQQPNSGSNGDFEVKLRELFARIASKVTNDVDTLRAYASLLKPSTDQPPLEDVQKFLGMAKKAHQAAWQSKTWEHDLEACMEMTRWAKELAASQLELAQVHPTSACAEKSSARMMLRSLVSGLGKKYPYEIDNNMQIAQEVTELKSLLQQCTPAST